MITPEGYFVRKNGEIVNTALLTRDDIVGMSMTDWAKVRQQNPWSMPKHENTSQAVLMSRDSVNVLGSEMGSGPTPGHPYSSIIGSNYNPFSNPPLNTKAEQAKREDDAYYAKEKHTLMLKEAKLQQLQKQHKEEALSLKKELSKPKAKTYQDYYWEYVDSTDPVKAAEAFANMMDKVTQDQEPAQSSSWVPDRVQTKTVTVHKKQRFIFHKGPMTNLEVIVAVAIGLQPELWLSLLHLVWGWGI